MHLYKVECCNVKDVGNSFSNCNMEFVSFHLCYKASCVSVTYIFE